MKKTLEEATNNYVNYCAANISENEDLADADKRGFIYGAKWQQERSYSEEEVLPLLEMLQKCKEYFLLQTSLKSEERADAIAQLIETFKKK